MTLASASSQVETASLIERLKGHMNALLKKKIDNPRVSLQRDGRRVIDAVVELLTHEDIDENFGQGRTRQLQYDDADAKAMAPIALT